MDQNKIGRFIMQLRKEKGCTQKQLADEIGVSDKAVSKWETGRGAPDTGMLLPICNALGVTVSELLAGERFSAAEVSAKADDTIISLLTENEKRDRVGIIKAIIGYVLVLAVLVVAGVSSQNVSWYFDVSSLVYIVVICAAGVLISGGKSRQSILRLLRRIVVPVGIVISLWAIIATFGSLSDTVTFGRNLHASLMAILYAVVAYIVLVILDRE